MIFIVKCSFSFDQEPLVWRVSAVDRQEALEVGASRAGQFRFPFSLTVRKARDQKERVSDLRSFVDRSAPDLFSDQVPF